MAAGSLFPSQAKESTRFKEDALKRRLFEMREVIDQSYADNGRYPKNLKTLENDGYPARIPTDPFTGRNDSWRTIPAKQVARSARQMAAIYDVKSGSMRTGLDGTRYANW